MLLRYGLAVDDINLLFAQKDNNVSHLVFAYCSLNSNMQHLGLVFWHDKNRSSMYPSTLHIAGPS